MTPPRRHLLLAILGSIAFRYACFVVMTFLVVWQEARPAPALPDLVIDRLDVPQWVYRYNLALWLIAYIPAGIVLLSRYPHRFVRYMVSCGLVSLLRGVCITLTGLGPINGADRHAGMSLQQQLDSVSQILNPLIVFTGRTVENEPLTKDYFFSGHAASTFMLLLYVWPVRWLRWLVLGLHVLVVLNVLAARLHYTIDIVAAYAFVFAVFTLREGSPSTGLRTQDLGRGWDDGGVR